MVEEREEAVRVEAMAAALAAATAEVAMAGAKVAVAMMVAATAAARVAAVRVAEERTVETVVRRAEWRSHAAAAKQTCAGSKVRVQQSTTRAPAPHNDSVPALAPPQGPACEARACAEAGQASADGAAILRWDVGGGGADCGAVCICKGGFRCCGRAMQARNSRVRAGGAGKRASGCATRERHLT